MSRARAIRQTTASIQFRAKIQYADNIKTRQGNKQQSQRSRATVAIMNA